MTHLASGPSIAVEVRAPGSLDTVTAFQEFVGPKDPKAANMI